VLAADEIVTKTKFSREKYPQYSHEQLRAHCQNTTTDQINHKNSIMEIPTITSGKLMVGALK
jgi:hypothetical protein